MVKGGFDTKYTPKGFIVYMINLGELSRSKLSAVHGIKENRLDN